jgi:CRP-like cAMP-binding protein
MSDDPISFLVRKLRTRSPISDDTEQAIRTLPFVKKRHDPPGYLVREGASALEHCSFILSGFAFRQKLTVNGDRQIVSIHMRGDFIDLQHLFLNRADHNVQALTPLETIDIERSALKALILREPSVGKALWIDALVDSSIFREWVINVGRRDARTRVAHLICEFAVRMQAAGLGDGQSCNLPMTQEQIGDATGLTSVHVNRVLKVLAAEGIVSRDKRQVWFDDWERIRAVADFSTLYLHLDQTTLPPQHQRTE